MDTAAAVVLRAAVILHRSAATKNDGQRGRTLRRPRLEEVRKLAALIGLLFIVGTEAGPVRVPRGVFATVGVLALMIASALVLIERRTVGRNSCEYGDSAPAPQSTRAWRWTLIGLACTGAVVAQTWSPGGDCDRRRRHNTTGRHRLDLPPLFSVRLVGTITSVVPDRRRVSYRGRPSIGLFTSLAALEPWRSVSGSRL